MYNWYNNKNHDKKEDLLFYFLHVGMILLQIIG